MDIHIELDLNQYERNALVAHFETAIEDIPLYRVELKAIVQFKRKMRVLIKDALTDIMEEHNEGRKI